MIHDRFEHLDPAFILAVSCLSISFYKLRETRLTDSTEPPRETPVRASHSQSRQRFTNSIT